VSGCDPGCACGACRGIRSETPLAVDNRPGLSAIRYRIGDHPRFKESLLAALSRGLPPALAGLTTRRDDDFSIGLLDAFAVMADVLTFYQERIAHESYLRTARERLSIGHIASLIGYELRPGAAAHASLAFTMLEGAGAVEKLTLPVGARVQSTPKPDQKAQTFETVEEVEVRPAWNRIPVRAVVEQALGPATAWIRLRGAASNLRPGDGVLLVFGTPAGADFTALYRRVVSVNTDPQARWTDATLSPPLASAAFDGLTPRQTGAFVFRKHASLFGCNAPDFTLLDQARKVPTNKPNWDLDPWATAPDRLVLDSVYREVVTGSWAILHDPFETPLVLSVKTAVEHGMSAYAISGKSTWMEVQRGKTSTTASTVPLNFVRLRATSVLVQAEPLELAEVPVFWPVAGTTVDFAHVVAGLVPGRTAVVQGKRLRAEVLKAVTLFLLTPSGWVQEALSPDDRLDLLLFPIPFADGAITVFVAIRDGLLGLVFARPGEVRFRNDEDGAELVMIAKVAADGRSVTIDPPLAHRYDPATASVTVNVAEATHGESVKEVFEGGDAARAFQRFALKQTPLTYVAATTPSGVRSTLRVWVDDVEWHEVPYLFGHGPDERVFVIRQDGEGKTWIQFGDGVTGARLPTGQHNVRAEYRRGLGSAGLLDAGQLNLLVSRPAGLKDVVNPLPSADGKDPEVLEDARRNAPLTVLTLDRVVSLQDYENFARAFAGIEKARATWTWFSHTRGVFITVAGFEGAQVSLAGREKLRAALATWGDPFVPTQVAPHESVTFRTGLRVKVDPDREPDKVLAAVETALRQAFSFAAREFGQPVTLSEVTAVAQGVRGVSAVQIVQLFRTADPDPSAGLAAPLPARVPRPGERGTVLPAELLTLDPAPLELLETLT
jgi:hypothetical protein